MNNAMNTKLSALATAIETQDSIVDTYEGMLSLCNDGKGADSILLYLARAEAEIDRLNREWNSLIIAAEAA